MTPELPIATPTRPRRADAGGVLAPDGASRQVAACHFDVPGGRLFGILDGPGTESTAGGVVLCHPHGADYGIAYRSMRVLATRLARAGFHVLRFDYLGTGDSSGDDDVATVEEWVGNVMAAVDTLRAMHGVEGVSLVGLRLGGSLAALAAGQHPHVDRVILWEPVIDGRAYLAEQRALHEAWIREERRNGRRAVAAPDEFLGHRIADRLREGLEKLQLRELPIAGARKARLLGHGEATDVRALADAWNARGVDIEPLRVDAPAIWGKTPSMPEPPVPHRALQAIVASLSEIVR